MNITVKPPAKTAKLTDAELAERKRRDAAVRASFAIEGIAYTAEEEALFESMDREGLTADECTQRIIEFCRQRGRTKSPA